VRPVTISAVAAATSGYHQSPCSDKHPCLKCKSGAVLGAVLEPVVKMIDDPLTMLETSGAVLEPVGAVWGDAGLVLKPTNGMQGFGTGFGS